MKNVLLYLTIFILLLSGNTLYANDDFWDTRDIIEPALEQNPLDFDNTEGGKEGDINVSIVGFDVENNDEAIEMINEMNEAAKESGTKCNVFYAGNEQDDELQKVLDDAVESSKGPSSFSQIVVNNFEDAVYKNYDKKNDNSKNMISIFIQTILKGFTK